MGKDGHLLLQVFAAAFRAFGPAAAHDQSFKFPAAVAADKIIQRHLLFSRLNPNNCFGTIPPLPRPRRIASHHAGDFGHHAV
jgi:hypothetical protein